MSSRADVEVSYDIGNDFFRIWLDTKMNYTCGVWNGAATLEEAQRQKLEIICDFARVSPGHRVLDIGCGWGAALEHLATERSVAEAHGITLSRAQYDEVVGRALPRVVVSHADYRDYAAPLQFDAVMCICMMEHIATPDEARKGTHIKLYRDFFRRVHEWTRPGASLGLQSILRDRVPRDAHDLREIFWATHTIFPGGLSLRLEDIVRSVAPYWEIMEARTRREDYEKTTAAWLERLERNEATITARWGRQVFDDYRRYLSGCVMAFEKRYQSLVQLSLRRIDDAPVARTRGQT